MATLNKDGKTYLRENEKPIANTSPIKTIIEDFTVDLDVPLLNPRTTQIPIKGSVGFSERQQMKNFRKIMTKTFGKGSVAQRTIPAENGVQYRLWRLR